MRKRIILLLIPVFIFLALSFTPPADRYFEIAKNLDIMASVFKEANELYVDEVNPNKLRRTGIDAMLGTLDPYTNFIAEDEVENYRTLNTGQYGGIGALTRTIGNRTVVTMIYKGFPAEKNGLKIGDEIIKMDEVALDKISIEEANRLMRGQVGTPVTLLIKREGVANPLEFTFKREKIKISNVPYFGMVSATVGYVQLTDFTPDAGREVKNAVLSLKEQGATSMILDLRDNPGGLLMEAVNICNIFIPKGKKVVSTQGKVKEHNVTYEALNSPVDLEIPLVVLINRGSASASEIVAGTLQDYDRAVVIGEKSFGKGLVQLSRPLSYNAQVKITTAKYYTPTGRCIQVLDYSHRREDGSVGAIPDSLKKEFKTGQGRPVFDGGGIDPDILVGSEEISTLAKVLYTSGLIFDYSTRYTAEHPSIPNPKDFKLSDPDYDDFVAWAKSKPYDYNSPLETGLDNLKSIAQKEKYYDDLKAKFDQIAELIKEQKKTDLFTFKDQIKTLLEKDIASRYYFEEGSVEVTFKDDKNIKKSIEILNSPTAYKSILHKI